MTEREKEIEAALRKTERYITKLRPSLLNPHVTDNYFGDLTYEGEKLKTEIDGVLATVRAALSDRPDGEGA